MPRQLRLSADDLNHYMGAMAKYANALIKLSSKMDKFDCSYVTSIIR